MNKVNKAAGLVEVMVNLEKIRINLEYMLERYTIWKSMLKVTDPNYSILWPCVTGNYGFGGDDALGDPTASFVSKRLGTVESLKTKVGFVELLLDAVDAEGRNFIEHRYFQRLRRNEVTAVLHISDSTYKRLRKKVLDTFLVILGIIEEEEAKFFPPLDKMAHF